MSKIILAFIISLTIMSCTATNINYSNPYISKSGEVYNKQLQTAWSAVLECYITNNYCNEYRDIFKYFIMENKNGIERNI